MSNRELPMSVVNLDRDALKRVDPGFIRESLTRKETIIIAVYDRHLAVERQESHGPQSVHAGQAGEDSQKSNGSADAPARSDGEVSPPLQLRTFALTELPERLVDNEETLWIYLGKVESRPAIALVVPDSISSREDGVVATDEWRRQYEWLSLRDLIEGSNHTLASIAIPAIALANWHVTSMYCGRCGAPTSSAQAGWIRVCQGCGTDHFPRTDSAVIMAVIDDQDRILLGNSAAWPENRFSTLAGFVEPGETLEDAVVREVFEESGIHVTDVTYWKSQPWPFPASLMLGYFARATSVEISVDREEIREARWFSRHDLREAVDKGEVTLPGRVSIARALIGSWLNSDTPFRR